MSKHSDTLNMIKDKIENLEKQRTVVNDKKLIAQAEVDNQDRELQVIDRQIERLNESRLTLETDEKMNMVPRRPAYDPPHL